MTAKRRSEPEAPAGAGPPPPERLSIRTPAPVLEELETRLEAGLLAPGAPPEVWARGGDACGCLGVLCLCDGHDCSGVCLGHCVLDYA